MQRILVWDWPVRIGHVLLVISFLVAWLTSEGEGNWHVLHLLAGGVTLAVVSFRILWGFIGSAPARFSSFVRGPHAIKAYMRTLLRLKPDVQPGHNPAGAIAIVLMLAATLVTALLGWGLEAELGGHWLEETHEAFASLLLTVVCVHIGGVMVESVLQRENLVRSMLDGYRIGQPDHAIRSSHPLAALVMLAWIVGVCGWLIHRYT